TCGQLTWNDWQLKSALTWGRTYFDHLTLGERIKAVFDAGGPGLTADILGTKLASLLHPEAYRDRFDALAPPEIIWARYQSGKFRPDKFDYSAYNIDQFGDMLQTKGQEYADSGVPVVLPRRICPGVIEILKSFRQRMEGRGLQVLAGHTPYI